MLVIPSEARDLLFLSGSKKQQIPRAHPALRNDIVRVFTQLLKAGQSVLKWLARAREFPTALCGLIERSWLNMRLMFYWRVCAQDFSAGEGMRPLICARLCVGLCGRFALRCRWHRQLQMHLVRRLRGPNRSHQSMRISTPPGMRFRDR